MPLDIDPDWEYYQPDPEIAEVIFNQRPEGFAGISDDRLSRAPAFGFRFGSGNPNRFFFRLARAKPTRVTRPTPQSRECLVCKRVFFPDRAGRKCCGNDCRHKLLHGVNKIEREQTTCPSCHKTFTKEWADHTYCSAPCQVVGQRKPQAAYGEGRCLNCGATYPPSSSRNGKPRLYCNRKCKHALICRRSRLKKSG